MAKLIRHTHVGSFHRFIMLSRIEYDIVVIKTPQGI